MIGSDIINYIRNPEKIKSANVEQLKEYVQLYPFSQAAHILLLKNLKDNNKLDELKIQLSKSSIHISDRDLLFKFLNTDLYGEEKKEIKADINTKEEIENSDSVKVNTKTEVEKVESDSKVKSEKVFLKNKNVKRKINDTIEGMGENISETISSQLQFSVLKDKDKLEYSSEIYFIDEERSGKNNIITIDADPDEIKKKKDILQIEENVRTKEEKEAEEKNDKDDDVFELIETEEIEKKKEKRSEYFDINNYADESALNHNDDLISRFIEKNPRIKVKETDDEVKDISEKSIEEDTNLLSETLIKVYIKQGLFEKAIESYRKLSLKYPEKNVYFASQIKILEDKINK